MTAKMMLNAGQRLLDDVKALEVLEWFSGGATTTLRAEAEALIIRALWMAPTGIGIKIGSAWFRLQGLTPEGVVRYGRKGPDGELINVGEVVATDVEDVAL
ncbi:hypothetical protein PSH03_005414 [Micromonospora sp. PSH03]|uniref:hypothetical protein n=1 Tax=Micromonospora salmantinae TaxID=2911211 RepID=UPI001EE850B7|nr:hypothetical protein [Micromonospora salmantinae]MCG5459630.1 hypothetical protein [Micromonospora salmantinae]